MGTSPEPEPELVKIFDTQQESEALIIHALLESAGIESIVSTLQAPQDVLPGVGGVIVRVNASRAGEALSIIEGYRNAPDEDSNETPE